MGNRRNKKKQCSQQALKLLRLRNLQGRSAVKIADEANQNQVQAESSRLTDDTAADRCQGPAEEQTADQADGITTITDHQRHITINYTFSSEAESSYLNDDTAADCCEGPAEEQTADQHHKQLTTTDEITTITDRQKHITINYPLSSQVIDMLFNKPKSPPEKTLEIPVESEIEKEPKSVTQSQHIGRRIVNIKPFFTKLQEISSHGSLGCGLNTVEIIREKQVGLRSKFTFTCKRCNKTFHVDSDTGSEINVNKCAVAGVVAIGGGHSQLEQFSTAMDLPVMSHKTYDMCRSRLPDVSDGLSHLVAKKRKTTTESATFDEPLERRTFQEEQIEFLSVSNFVTDPSLESEE